LPFINFSPAFLRVFRETFSGSNPRVDACVVQNGFFYIREGVPEPAGLPHHEPWPLRMVHPRLFEHTLAKMSDPETLKACLTAKKALMMLPALIRRSVMERLPS
jgi:pyrimidine deaminase RibD-like protein